MAYLLEGRLVEICSCATLCPCWAGFDPDNGACQLSWIFHFDRGHCDGVDMAGVNVAVFGVLEGNAQKGQGHMVGVLDEKSNEEQKEVCRQALRGELPGPLGDLGKLIVELIAIETAPIEFDVEKGTGTYRAGDWFSGESEVIRSPMGRRMEIQHSVLAPVLGNPAYPGRVVSHQITDPHYGMEFSAHQSTQTNLRYVWNDAIGEVVHKAMARKARQKDS